MRYSALLSPFWPEFKNHVLPVPLSWTPSAPTEPLLVLTRKNPATVEGVPLVWPLPVPGATPIVNPVPEVAALQLNGESCAGMYALTTSSPSLLRMWLKMTCSWFAGSAMYHPYFV